MRVGIEVNSGYGSGEEVVIAAIFGADIKNFAFNEGRVFLEEFFQKVAVPSLFIVLIDFHFLRLKSFSKNLILRRDKKLIFLSGEWLMKLRYLSATILRLSGFSPFLYFSKLADISFILTRSSFSELKSSPRFLIISGWLPLFRASTGRLEESASRMELEQASSWEAEIKRSLFLR